MWKIIRNYLQSEDFSPTSNKPTFYCNSILKKKDEEADLIHD